MHDLTIVEQPRSDQLQPPLRNLSNHRVPHQCPNSPPVGPFRVVPNTKAPVQSKEIKVRFWFRTRLIQATARLATEDCRNVLLLQIAPSIITQLFDKARGLLAPPLRSLVERVFLEWNLPSRLVLKICKDDWDEEFEIEKSTYDKFKDTQGILVPKFYGVVHYNGKRALLLSDIGGECLGSPAGAILEMNEFRRRMRMTLKDLSIFGILVDDVRLENFRVVGNKVMALDFELVREPEAGEDVEEEVTRLTNWLARLYQGNQRCFLDDGSIEPEKLW